MIDICKQLGAVHRDYIATTDDVLAVPSSRNGENYKVGSTSKKGDPVT